MAAIAAFVGEFVTPADAAALRQLVERDRAGRDGTSTSPRTAESDWRPRGATARLVGVGPRHPGGASTAAWMTGPACAPHFATPAIG